MPRVLVRKSPAAFKTLPLYVEASQDNLSYQSLGRPLNFSEVIERRRPVVQSSRLRPDLRGLPGLGTRPSAQSGCLLLRPHLRSDAQDAAGGVGQDAGQGVAAATANHGFTAVAAGAGRLSG